MAKRKLKILLVNDDGIQAPGLEWLWKAMEPWAELIIVAPASQQSGKGLGITTEEPLHVKKYKWSSCTEAYSVSGTPADCVKVGISRILQAHPDLILSGINAGCNAGRNVLYSGTVGGVIEGVLRGVPGIAFSCQGYPLPLDDFPVAAQHIPKVVEYVLENPLPSGMLLNVNFPENIQGGIQGFRMARQGRGYFMEDFSHSKCPEGHDLLEMGGKRFRFEEHEESDIALLEQGFMTAVPLKVEEFTHHSFVDDHRDSFSNLHLPMNGTTPV